MGPLMDVPLAWMDCSYQFRHLLLPRLWACQIIFSGHYQAYGINVQAACDAHCQFVCGSLAAPGGTNDIVAFQKTSIFWKINSLPIGNYVIGNNAYVCSENLLTPFSGQQRLESAMDSYNFYLSQLQICIEMTFGQFVNKWGLFKRPLQICLKNVGFVFMCATWLHNFCMNEQSGTVDLEAGSNDEEEQEGKAPFMEADANVVSVPGNSIVRDLLLEEIAARALVRPSHNIQRNRDNNDQNEQQI
jgi:hypothetical protein